MSVIFEKIVSSQRSHCKFIIQQQQNVCERFKNLVLFLAAVKR